MVTARQAGLTRKHRRELARRLQLEDPGLDVMHPHAAGIDVGNSAHYVEVRPDRDPHSVRRFECFTADFHRLADWLQQCGVTTVAMQSTGVYWIPLYEILDARGVGGELPIVAQTRLNRTRHCGDPARTKIRTPNVSVWDNKARGVQSSDTLRGTGLSLNRCRAFGQAAIGV